MYKIGDKVIIIENKSLMGVNIKGLEAIIFDIKAEYANPYVLKLINTKNNSYIHGLNNATTENTFIKSNKYTKILYGVS